MSFLFCKCSEFLLNVAAFRHVSALLFGYEERFKEVGREITMWKENHWKWTFFVGLNLIFFGIVLSFKAAGKILSNYTSENWISFQENISRDIEFLKKSCKIRQHHPPTPSGHKYRAADASVWLFPVSMPFPQVTSFPELTTLPCTGCKSSI